ncbi:MAG: nitroreductase family protein [Planctomycetes bacterium]|nr:nitroreductase family protein [Planctomycetota bacterium]
MPGRDAADPGGAQGDVTPRFVPYAPAAGPRVADAEVLARAQAFRRQLETRRSVRHFSDAPVARAVIEELVRAAASAPSGAHKQPWTFVVVGDPALKRRIRAAAEHEERLSYGGRMSEEWLRDLAPLGTTWEKPFLEVAPWLVVLFKQEHALHPDGSTGKHYYVNESVGIAAGFFIAAVHAAGLVTLTHTPSPMGFLAELLGRPRNEKAFLLLPVGHPAPGAEVPDLRRKPLAEVSAVHE